MSNHQTQLHIKPQKVKKKGFIFQIAFFFGVEVEFAIYMSPSS